MKKSLVPATLVAVLFALGFATQQAGAQNSTPSYGTRVAVIDVPYIFKNHARFKADINAIKADIDAYKQFVTQEQKKIRAEAEKIEQFNPGTPQYKQIEENVARMKVELQLEGAKRQKDFMEREAKVYFNAYREIEAVVTEFAQRNRIGLVLRFNGEEMDATQRESIMQGINRIVVYQDHLNITNLVLQRLNAQRPRIEEEAKRPVVPGQPQF